MNFEIEKLVTPKGKTRHQLRIWNFGGERLELKRRYVNKNDLFSALDGFKKDHERELSEESEKDLTLKEIHQDFLMRKAHTFSPGWQRALKGYWRELEPKVALLKSSEILPTFLKSLEVELRQSGNSVRTANMKIGFIQSILRFASDMDLIVGNKSAKFKKTKPTEVSRGFWELGDAEDFLKFASEKYPPRSEERWKYVVYLVGINAALRASEIWALKPRCLKRDQGVIRIDEQWDLNSKSFRPPKGRGPRNVPLNSTLADELEALIMQRGIGRHEVIFGNRASKPMNHLNFYKRVFVKEFGEGKSAAECIQKSLWAGPRIVFHGLRHTGATLMLDAGIDVRTVQEILGHRDMTTTLRYVHALGKNVKSAGESFSIAPKPRSLQIVR